MNRSHRKTQPRKDWDELAREQGVPEPYIQAIKDSVPEEEFEYDEDESNLPPYDPRCAEKFGGSTYPPDLSDD